MYKELLEEACETLLDIAPEGIINASSAHEVFGCLFGRDAALTILKLLRVLDKNINLSCIDNSWIIQTSQKTLLKLVELQGQVINIESGEEPGKFIHEYRTSKFQRLTKKPKNPLKPWLNPWYLYPDKTIRSYDSVDSTPLVLIAIYKFVAATNNSEFLSDVLPAVEKGLNWILSYADMNKDYLLDYMFDNNRRFGGLRVQSWTDSDKWLADKNKNFPKYPITPMEPQGFTWLALKLWSKAYLDSSPVFSQKLDAQADKLKVQFNNKFIYKDSGLYFPAQALDGDGNQIKVATGNGLFLLWSALKSENQVESILASEYIKGVIKRSFQKDLFEKNAGLRTMSSASATFNPKRDSYHNGSFWPMLNGFAYEGLLNFGFTTEAQMLREASLKPLRFFKTPVEVYILGKNSYQSFIKGSRKGCLYQAWSAAVIVDFLTE